MACVGCREDTSSRYTGSSGIAVPAGERTVPVQASIRWCDGGLYEATTDAWQIQRWWRQWRSAKIGIMTGAESGIVVIDVDLPAAIPSFTPLLELGFPPTLTGLTGGGGIHLVYASEDRELGNSAGHLPAIGEELPGIDLRASGGYVVAPPSMHISGNRYSWLLLAGPNQVEDPDNQDQGGNEHEETCQPVRHVSTIPMEMIAPAPEWLKQPAL